MKNAIYSFVTLIFLFASTQLSASGLNNIGANGLGLQGFDPVSYHQGEGPVEGLEELIVTEGNVVYRFASKTNKELFENDPEKYIPAYGGWCAWAMLQGEKVGVNPERYKVINGKTHLYYTSFFVDTLKKWDKAAEADSESVLVEKAEDHWQKIIQAFKG